MQTKNLKEEARRILVEFLNVDKKDPMKVMEWFYQSLPLNSMFEEKTIAEFITKLLEENGYSTSGMKEELLAYRQLVKKEEATKEEMATSLIRFALAYIKESFSLDPAIICYIRHFNEEYNKEFAQEYMEKLLSMYMGEKVIFTMIENGEYSIKTGTLLSHGNKIVEIGDYFIQYEDLCEIHTEDGIVLFHQEKRLDEKHEKSSEKIIISEYNTDIGMLI